MPPEETTLGRFSSPQETRSFDRRSGVPAPRGIPRRAQREPHAPPLRRSRRSRSTRSGCSRTEEYAALPQRPPRGSLLVHTLPPDQRRAKRSTPASSRSPTTLSRSRRQPQPRLLRQRGPRLPKAGRGLRHTSQRGHHTLIASRSDTGEVLHTRLRKGSENTARGTALRRGADRASRVRRREWRSCCARTPCF